MNRSMKTMLVTAAVALAALPFAGPVAADVDEIQARSHVADEARGEAERLRAQFLKAYQAGFKIEAMGGMAWGASEAQTDIGLSGGARIGYLLPAKVYFGATVVGLSGSYFDSSPTVESKETETQFYGGGEVGYEWRQQTFSVRPYAGLGVGTSNHVGAGAAIWPGVLGTVHFQKQFYMGLDFRYALFTVSRQPGVQGFLVIGFSL
jgi:hypothetical protein